MKVNSAAVNDESGIQSDLNRYKQAAEVAYQYVKNREEKPVKEEQSPFGEKEDKEPTQDKESL